MCVCVWVRERKSVQSSFSCPHQLSQRFPHGSLAASPRGKDWEHLPAICLNPLARNIDRKWKIAWWINCLSKSCAKLASRCKQCCEEYFIQHSVYKMYLNYFICYTLFQFSRHWSHGWQHCSEKRSQCVVCKWAGFLFRKTMFHSLSRSLNLFPTRMDNERI